MTVGGLPLGYLAALGLTLAAEVPVVAALFPGRRLRMALVCAAATTATHLLLVFGLPRLLPAGAPLLWIGEAFATLGEAAAYWAADGQDHQPGRALVASALANGLSFGAGWVLLG